MRSAGKGRMTPRDITELILVVLSVVGSIWFIVRHIDNKFKEVKKDFGTVWSRFDQFRNHVSDFYLKKEVYHVNHKGLEDAMAREYKALKDLMDEKMKYIIESLNELKHK